ncbi:MAG: DUF192 domain-containing protein [Zoogloeaceae bacterium]|jgi:uncharacterized membrane protein (UPF0127 family)|nr:DUF192 domain-containing protein [Zoogloeaceae bacterium]
MKKILFFLSCACLVLTGATLAAAQQQATLPRLDLTVGFYRIVVEVAATPETRQIGLMGRRGMAAHEGMLFVFPQAARHCMWMKNTLLPLSVAFLDDSGRVINIRNMKPGSEENHCADTPARFALEMNQGWFAAKGVAVGSEIKGVERAMRPR